MSQEHQSSEQLDPQRAMQLAMDSAQQVRQATEPNGALIFLTWGLAYLIGFGSIWLTGVGILPLPVYVPVIVMPICMLLGLIVTVILTLPLSRGLRGVQAQQSTRYGISWGLASALMAVFGGVISTRLADGDLRGQLIGSVCIAIVGVMYLFGGALYRSTSFFGLGGWFALTAAVGALVPPNLSIVIFTLAGAGGLFAGAAITWWVEKRQGGATNAR